MPGSFRDYMNVFVSPTVALGQLSPEYLDPKYWEQTFIGYSIKRDRCFSLFRLGLMVGYFTNFSRFRRPFDGFLWYSFPVAKWNGYLCTVHRSFFLYGSDLIAYWYKKRNKHIRKAWQVSPSDIYVPEIWNLHEENVSKVLADLWNMTSSANFPREISERFFSFSTLAHDHLSRHQPKSRQEEERVDLDELIDPADYTLHQLEALFPALYNSMTEDHKRMHREERKRRKELAEKEKKREQRKATKNNAPSDPPKPRKQQKPREKKRYFVTLEDGSQLDITDLPGSTCLRYVEDGAE